MKKIGILLVVAVAATSVVGHVAHVQAFPPFKKEFENLYIKESPTTDPEKSLKEAATTAKCGICHNGPEGKDKKHRNTYGKAMEGLMPKDMSKEDLDAFKKDVPKIKDLIEKTAKEHSDPADPKSPTFGDLIKEGKLPGKETAAK